MTSNSHLNRAEQLLLAPQNLAVSDIEATLYSIMLPSIDYADCNFQHASLEVWAQEDNKVKTGTDQNDQCVGIRALSGEKTGFAYSDEITLRAL